MDVVTTDPASETPPAPSPEAAAPIQLSLLAAPDVPVQFRLDAETRRRGLRHVAEIRAHLAARQAARATDHPAAA